MRAPLGWRLLLSVGPLAIALVWRLVNGGAPGFSNDDAYISEHAARLLFAGVDPSYREGPPLIGATSPLHVLVLWLAMRAFSPATAVEVVTWAGAACYFAAVAALVVARLTNRVQQAAVVCVAALGGSAALQLANGQETGWAMAAVLWVAVWLDRDNPSGSRLAWAAGILPWIRPELAILSVAIFVWRWSTGGRIPWRDAAVMALCWSIYGLFMWVAIGQPLPNTMEAKRQFFATYSVAFDLKVLAGLYLLAQWVAELGPLTIGLLVVRRESDRLLGYSLVLLLAALIVAGPNMISHNWYRYLYPFAMPLILASLTSLADRWRGAILALATIWVVALVPWRWQDWTTANRFYVAGQADVAGWLIANAPQNSSILVHDAGYLSEHTPFRLTDVVGLKSPSSIPLHAKFTGPTQGKRRALALHAIACRARPDYFVVFSGWDIAFKLTPALTQFGWNPTPVFQRSVEGRQELMVYTVYKLTYSSRCVPVGQSFDWRWPQAASSAR